MTLVDLLGQGWNLVGKWFLMTTLILFSIYWTFYYAYYEIRKSWLINSIPGPKTNFFFGNSSYFAGSENEIFKTITETFCSYGDGMSRIWIGSKPWCYIYRADVVEQLLKSKADTEKPFKRFHNAFLGDSLLAASGSQWAKRRKMLNPAFHYKILENSVKVWNKHCAEFIKNLESKANGRPVEILQTITRSTLVGLLESVLGHSVDCDEKAIGTYSRAIGKLEEIMPKRNLQPWIQPDFLFRLFGYKKIHDEAIKIVNDFTEEILKKRCKQIQDSKFNQKENSLSHHSFLDFLLENYENNNITREDMHYEINGQIAAGHITVSAAIFWTLYLLGHHKEIQEMVIEEMDSIFGESERSATMEDLREMRYLECCIKETLRIYPVTPVIARVLKEDMTLDGKLIPAGVTVQIIIFRLHRDPKEYPDPEVYNPERFFPENYEKLSPYAYIPFGGGPRKCIGHKFAMTEVKTFLSSFFRKYRIQSLVNMEELKFVRRTVLTAENGNCVRIYKRQ